MRNKISLKEELQNKSFANEEDEANWWDSPQGETLSEEFLRAAAEGRLDRKQPQES